MTNNASGAQHMSTLVGLGVLLLLGATALLFQGSDSGSESSADTMVTALLAAQSTMRVAGLALSTGSDQAYERLEGAASQLAAANQRGLAADQAKAVRSLTSGIETIQSTRAARGTLVLAATAITSLMPEVADRINGLEQAAIVQNRPIVAAQLERLRMLVSGLNRDIQTLATGVGDAALDSQRLLDAEMAIAQIIRGFEAGDPVLGLRAVSGEEAATALADLQRSAGLLGDEVRNVLAVSDQLAAANFVRGQFDEWGAVLASGQLSGAATGATNYMQRNILVGLIGVAVLLFLIIGWLNHRTRDIRRATELQAEQTERNQKAIMRLLDELGSLADGDLTIKATVTEDITGAIADSINFAIEALRELVVTLNDSAIMVDGAAKQTDVTAQQLAEASESQSKQIEAASEAIMGMAASIEEISGNAERSSDVARHSVDVAHKGGEAVRRTIEGMNMIRETIQDTSKRIKRLGESSQEIGNIVELINDIADQTNILALNASIQASMAGEAGRGFAVVADEVQRLAERSANATKQIEVLVRTIQSDTNEAVVSMERSTTDVVGGALLAENAGAALEEIEQVSNQIASLVQNISGSAREQSSAAAMVTSNMDRLQEINVQTEVSTSATTGSIRELAELAAQLRESVSGFRLPDADGDVNADLHEAAERNLDVLIGDPMEDAGSDEISFVDQKTA
jgi:twitching motility protein PilJ